MLCCASAAPTVAEPAHALTSERATQGAAAVSPSASITINAGAATTADPTLTLAVVADGFGAELTMRFSLDGGTTWTDAEPWAPSRAFDLPAKWRWGLTTVSVELRDGAGQTALADDSIEYEQAPRSAMRLRPSYLLQASLDYAAARLATRQTVDITNDADAPIGYLDFSVLARRYDELAIEWVEVDGARVTPSYTNRANMRVPLGYNLRPGESARVVIRFVATASSSTSDHLRARFAKANGLMQISSWHPLLSDGHGLQHPGDSQFSVAADYRLELEHPRSVVVAAPGELVERGATRKVYELARAREYAFAASPGFVRSTTTTEGGVDVEVYNLAGTEGAANARSAARLALERHAARLGPYPYGRFVIAQGVRPTSALEYSGVVFLGRLNFGHRLTVAHEVAHQWWYGIVGNDQLAEPWLDEAFAEFTSRRLLGQSMPSSCSTRFVDLPVTAFSPTSTGCNSYAQTVYFRGARFLDGVRQRLGERRFWRALAAIVDENRFGIATTGEVRATFRRFSTTPRQLDAYMDGYLATP